MIVGCGRGACGFDINFVEERTTDPLMSDSPLQGQYQTQSNDESQPSYLPLAKYIFSNNIPQDNFVIPPTIFQNPKLYNLPLFVRMQEKTPAIHCGSAT